MNILQVKELLNRIGQLTDTWTRAEVPAIEREIVLAKLQRLYEMIRFDAPEDAVCNQEVTPAVDSSLRASTPEASKEEVAVETPVVDSVTEDSSRSTQEVTTPDRVSMQAERPSSEPVESSSREASPEAFAPTPSPVASVEPAGMVEPTLFQEDALARMRPNQEMIRSLYGDAPEVPIRPHGMGMGMGMGIPSQRVTPVTHSVNEPILTPDPQPSKKVLGEAFESQSVPVNEMLGKQQNHTDVASRLHAQSVVYDLQQCIGVNDRFMLIRNLFHGDSAAYAAAIAQFNTFTDLDDALLYMQENFQWNPDDEGVRLLVDLLERKLN
ncbi:MAG: hypothetical protein PHV49_06600 [Alistipes sp.]|nr:hypothetical protein [Alistipes sp.]